jgi:hypothetical protein
MCAPEKFTYRLRTRCIVAEIAVRFMARVCMFLKSAHSPEQLMVF